MFLCSKVISYCLFITADQVHMKDKNMLDEYVINDVGKIWVGPNSSTKGREWVFGQFDAVVLPSVDLMLERTSVAPEDRGNPILVTRALSKIVSTFYLCRSFSFESPFLTVLIL